MLYAKLHAKQQEKKILKGWGMLDLSAKQHCLVSQHTVYALMRARTIRDLQRFIRAVKVSCLSQLHLKCLSLSLIPVQWHFISIVVPPHCTIKLFLFYQRKIFDRNSPFTIKNYISHLLFLTCCWGFFFL